MKELFYAVYDLFGSKISGVALHYIIAPAEVELPYVVVSIIPGVPDDTFTERSETGILQFNIYSDDPTLEEALDLKTSIQDAFDYTRELVVVGYSVVSFRREIGAILKEENQGNQVWSVMIQYSFIIERN